MGQGSTTQPVAIRGSVSTANSSTANLGISGVFTGAFEEMTDFAFIAVSIIADQASASNGLTFQWSSDGVNVDQSDISNVLANTGRSFALTVRARYFRIVYTNGVVAQTAFRLNTVFHQSGVGTITKPISTVITDDSFAQLIQAVITGKRTDGAYGTVGLDNSNRFQIAPPGSVATTKGFSDGKVVLSAIAVTAVRATTYTEQTANAQRSILSTSANDAAAGTGARTVRVTYYALAAGVVTGPFTETISLNGVTFVNTIATNICFIEKIEVLTVGSGGSNAGVISLMSATGGGGVAVWSVAVGDNKTFGSHHYVPNGKTANITGFVGGIKGGNDTTGFFLRAKDPTNANSAEIQISDALRVPTGSQSNRVYGTSIEVVGPSRITAYADPDTASTRTYFASFDFYEQ